MGNKKETIRLLIRQRDEAEARAAAEKQTRLTKVMSVSGVVSGSDSVEVPFWVENTGRHARVASAPRADWKAWS